MTKADDVLELSGGIGGTDRQGPRPQPGQLAKGQSVEQEAVL